mgnify:CR=1 FL=1
MARNLTNTSGIINNIYLNSSAIAASLPVQAIQPTLNDPITISLKGLPTSFSGSAGKSILVNSGETGLEYAVIDPSLWTESGSNIYPKNVGQVLINTTTNTNNRNLLINGNAEIGTNLFLSGNSSEIEIDSNSSTGIFFKNATSQGFKLYAQNGEFGSPEFDMEDSRGVFRIKQTGTLKYELDDGDLLIYSNNSDITKINFVKASNTNIGNYINNDFTNNLFEFRNFTATTDNIFLSYNTSTDELTLPQKLNVTGDIQTNSTFISTRGSMQLSDGSNFYSLPFSSGILALTSDIPTNNNELTNGAGYITSSSIPTALWSASSTTLSPSPSSNNKILLAGSSSSISGDLTNTYNSSYPHLGYGSFQTCYTKNVVATDYVRIVNASNTSVDITCDSGGAQLNIDSDVEITGGLKLVGTGFITATGNIGCSGSLSGADAHFRVEEIGSTDVKLSNPSGTNASQPIMLYSNPGDLLEYNCPNSSTATTNSNYHDFRFNNLSRMRINGSTNPGVRLFQTNGTNSYAGIGYASTFPSNFGEWSSQTIPIGSALYFGGKDPADSEGTLLAMNGETMMISNPGDDETLKYYDEDGRSLSWYITTSGVLTSTSDSRVKTEIETYKNSNFGKYKQIRTITYKQKIPENINPKRLEKQSCINKYNNIHYGIIAQEIYSLYPELEDTDSIRKRDEYYYRKDNWTSSVYEKEYNEWKIEKEKFECESKEKDKECCYMVKEPPKTFIEEEPIRSFGYEKLPLVTIGVVQDLIKENETLKTELDSIKELLRKNNIV